MAILNQKRILNLIPKVSAPVTIHVSQGDVGTEIEFTLVKGDEVFVNPGNVSASVHGVREDGANFGPFTCTLSGSKVTFPLHSEMTAVKGSAIAEVVLVNGGNKVGSANFGILVEESVFPLGVTYDNDVSVYESILAYAQTISAQVQGEIADLKIAITNAIVTESNARSIADSNLQTQIDEIVAPSGEAPSAAEVQNARIGVNGVVYDSLGNAIRLQIGTTNENLDIQSKNLNNIDTVQKLDEKVLSDLRGKSDYLSTVREVDIYCEDGTPLTDESDNALQGNVFAVITDNTLTLEKVPADAKKVGQEFERVDNLIRDADVDYTQFGLLTLFLEGDVSDMSKSNAKTLAYKFNDKEGTCSCKWQGSSSLAYPKKNYTITFDENITIVDRWGAHKKYCFKANWIDFSHARNVVSAKLWGNVVRDRHMELSNLLTEAGENLLTEDSEIITGYEDKFLQLPNGGAVDGFPCVIYLNGKFHGLYSWNIPKDKWMMNMGKSNTEYIVTAENHTEATRFRTTALVDGTDFEIEYKKNNVSEETVIDSLNTMLQAVVDCHDSAAFEALSNYIDIDSAIDYFIFISLLGAIDCVSKNYILATYDGVKWFFTAYDLDSVYGNDWDGKSNYSYYSYPFISEVSHRMGYLLRRYALSALKERYEYLVENDGILSKNNIYMTFNKYLNSMPLSVKNKDAEYWKTIPGTTTNTVAQIIDYYNHRVDFVTKDINNI